MWSPARVGRSTWITGTSTGTSTNSAICPDLLSIRDLGEADSWRGHLIRAVFIVLKKMTGV